MLGKPVCRLATVVGNSIATTAEFVQTVNSPRNQIPPTTLIPSLQSQAQENTFHGPSSLISIPNRLKSCVMVVAPTYSNQIN
jgi:hypothetical protein